MPRKILVKVKNPDPEVSKLFPFETLEFDSKREAQDFQRKMQAAGIYAKVL